MGMATQNGQPWVGMATQSRIHTRIAGPSSRGRFLAPSLMKPGTGGRPLKPSDEAATRNKEDPFLALESLQTFTPELLYGRTVRQHDGKALVRVLLGLGGSTAHDTSCCLAGLGGPCACPKASHCDANCHVSR